MVLNWLLINWSVVDESQKCRVALLEVGVELTLDPGPPNRQLSGFPYAFPSALPPRASLNLPHPPPPPPPALQCDFSGVNCRKPGLHTQSATRVVNKPALRFRKKERGQGVFRPSVSRRVGCVERALCMLRLSQPCH